MRQDEPTFTATRRRLLRAFGLGAAGTAMGAVVATDRIFAKQFVGDGPDIKFPKMEYDPELQLMVDPQTRRPIYEDAGRINVASGLPTVTAKCGDCPKKDDTGS